MERRSSMREVTGSQSPGNMWSSLSPTRAAQHGCLLTHCLRKGCKSELALSQDKLVEF